MLARVSRREAEAWPYKIWNAFVELVARDPADLASLEQRSASLVFRYESEVQNGGHLQYLSNRGLIEAREAVAALRDLDAPRHAANLEAALASLPADTTSDPVLVDEYVAIVLEDRYSEADEMFAQLEPLAAVLERYLEANVSAFIEFYDDGA
jgi:hypothetical protein